MNLFRRGKFKLASGQESKYKIECDALQREDWDTLAYMISERVTFTEVIGVPNGGLPLAEALQRYKSDHLALKRKQRLVVDDVYTTGGSISKYLNDYDIGFVVFARGPIRDNRIQALWYSQEAINDQVQDLQHSRIRDQ